MTFRDEQGVGDPNNYQAYLIRMWQDGHQAAWRASAKAVQDGQMERFATLQALFAFLEAQTRPDEQRSAVKTDHVVD